MNNRSTGGRPTRQEAAERLETLLDTARELIGAKGFAGASIDEVALRLRASKHTIYRRFPTKLALLEAIVARDTARFGEALRRAGEGAVSAVDDLRAKAKAYFGFSLSRPYSALYSAILLEANTSAELRARLIEWAGTSLQPLYEAIERTAKEQAWAGRDPIELCGLLIDLLDGQATRLKWRDDVSDAQIEDACEDRWRDFLALAARP